MQPDFEDWVNHNQISVPAESVQLVRKLRMTLALPQSVRRVILSVLFVAVASARQPHAPAVEARDL